MAKDIEATVRQMIAARKESIEYYENEIDESVEFYKGAPRALVRGTKFAMGQIEQFEQEIELLKLVLVLSGLAHMEEEV